MTTVRYTLKYSTSSDDIRALEGEKKYILRTNTFGGVLNVTDILDCNILGSHSCVAEEVVWDVTLCSWASGSRRFESTTCRNFGNRSWYDTASHLRWNLS